MNAREKLIIHLDDHSLFSYGLTKAVLSKLPPHSYHHFPDSSSALSFIKSCHEQWIIIDLVITDFNHIGMNGYHFANQVRMSEMKNGLNRTPIMMLTMVQDDHELIKEGLKTKLITKYFPKSASIDELMVYMTTLPEVKLPDEFNLADTQLWLNTQHKCRLSWIFSVNIYRNILEGNPSVESGDEALAYLENIAKQMKGSSFNYVYEKNKIGTEILPIRGNIAVIDDAYRNGNIIWFDDGKADAMERLARIIDETGFENMTVDYEF